MAGEPETIAELRRALGTQLAIFRLAAELTQGQLAKIVVCDRTVIVHIEKGRARGDERFWRVVDEAVGADGALLAGCMELETAKAEHEQGERDKRLATVRAKVAALRGQAGRKVPPSDVPVLDDLRRSVLGYQVRPDSESGGRVPASSARIAASVMQAHRAYQLADYDGTARLLAQVLHRVEATPASAGTTVPLATKATAYLANAKLATKLGDLGLAWVAADRCLRLAAETERHSLVGIARYQVACALLGAGHLADAEQTAATEAERLASAATCTKPKACREDTLSVHGALLLLLSIMAARRGDATAARAHLQAAARLAEQLGRDGNWLWTAFGPTNVAIHELSVQVALGDAKRVMRLGAAIDTDALHPVLRGRRSQVHLELGWASAGQGKDALAVLHLLEAERVAEPAVPRNAMANELLTTLLARERQSATPGLRALASRAGVLA